MKGSAIIEEIIGKKQTKMQRTIELNNNWKLSADDRAILLQHFPDGIIALDLETTGLSPLIDKIIEIAAIKITPHEDLIFETLVNPEIEIPAHTIEIHNISDEMVKNAPLIEEVLPQFNQFIGDLPIVAHNAKFDLGFIVLALQKSGHKLSESKIYCSVKLSRTTYPDLINHKLKTLVEHHQIPLVNHHRAIDDAYASLRVFIQGLKIIKSEYLNKTAMLFKLNEFDQKSKEPLPKYLNNIEKLVQEAAIVEIKYNGGSMRNEFRPVKLTSLINSPEGNFLYARCLISDIYKSFKLKKITDLRGPSASDIQKWLKKS